MARLWLLLLAAPAVWAFAPGGVPFSRQVQSTPAMSRYAVSRYGEAAMFSGSTKAKPAKKAVKKVVKKAVKKPVKAVKKPVTKKPAKAVAKKPVKAVAKKSVAKAPVAKNVPIAKRLAPKPKPKPVAKKPAKAFSSGGLGVWVNSITSAVTGQVSKSAAKPAKATVSSRAKLEAERRKAAVKRAANERIRKTGSSLRRKAPAAAAAARAEVVKKERIAREKADAAKRMAAAKAAYLAKKKIKGDQFVLSKKFGKNAESGRTTRI